MKKSTVIIFLSLLLASCTCHKAELTDSEKEWCYPYKQGQILVFKSDKKNIDTILVSDKTQFHSNEECNWIEIGTAQNEGIVIKLKPKICRNPSYCEAEIAIIKEENENLTLSFFRVFGLEYDRSNNNQLIEKPIQILNRNLKAFYFEEGKNCRGYGNDYLKSFYWSKEIGLLQYESKDGEIFKLTATSSNSQ